MSKTQNDSNRGTFRVCIEINEVEIEVICVTTVAELNAKMGHFFAYYNISNPLIQTKVKRRVLASYNRMIRETQFGFIRKDSRDARDLQAKNQETPLPPSRQKQMMTEQKKQTSSLCLKPKSGFSSSGFKMGFGSAAFLKTLSGIRPVEKDACNDTSNHQKNTQMVITGSKKTPALDQTLPNQQTNIVEVVHNPSTRYKASRTVADAIVYNMPSNGCDNPAFSTGPNASKMNEGRFQDVHSEHARRRKFESVPEAFDPNDQRMQAQFPPGSIQEDVRAPVDKTSKKPSMELHFDCNRRLSSPQAELSQHTPVADSHMSLRDPPGAGYLGDSRRKPATPDPQVHLQVLTPKDIFTQLDGMKIGLISQKNLNISGLSVSTLKCLQPVISGIYSGDEATCYDLRDFERLLGHMRIDLTGLAA